MAEIIKCIPPNSTCIDVYLVAPRRLYQHGMVAENTQLLISKRPYHQNTLTIIGIDDVPYEDEHRNRERKEAYPNINYIATKQKLFSSVKFQEATFDTPGMTIDSVKDLLQYFINKGYQGWIRAHNLYDNPDRFALNHSDRKIELTWDFKYHSPKRKNLQKIIANFEKLGLNEIKE